MNSAEYTFLLSHPEAVTERQTDALETIVTEFPYFQSARALRLKGLYNLNSFQYNYALKVTAAYTTDRSVLFDFITSDSFTAIQKGQYEQKPELENSATKTYAAEEIAAEAETAQERPTDSELAKQSILTSIRESENRPEAIEPEETTAIFETAEAEQPVAESAANAIEPVGQINAEEFGPVYEEPQFLPEAVAPMEFATVDTIEFVPVATAEAANAETETEPAQETTAEETAEMETPETEIAAGPVTISEAFEPEAIAANEEILETDRKVESAETPEVEEIEAKLEIGKPLAFSKDETHSFAEWLQLSKLQPIVRDEIVPETTAENTISANETQPAAENESGKITKDALIDRFIEANPKMPKIKADAEPVVIEQKDDHSALMTETLARVYLEQRKYQKAIQAYEILILKYPEKSSFFADRISEIKNLQQNNTF